MVPIKPVTLREKAARARIGWPAIVVIAAAGWVWDLVQYFGGGRLRYGNDPSVAISFAAMWLVLVLWVMAAWDLWIAIDDDPGSPSLGFGPQNHWIPRRLRSYLFPLSFVIGAYLGHKFWL
jgi:amino acid transporter